MERKNNKIQLWTLVWENDLNLRIFQKYWKMNRQKPKFLFTIPRSKSYYSPTSKTTHDLNLLTETKSGRNWIGYEMIAFDLVVIQLLSFFLLFLNNEKKKCVSGVKIRSKNYTRNIQNIEKNDEKLPQMTDILTWGGVKTTKYHISHML